MDDMMASRGLFTSLRDAWRRGRTRVILASLDDQRLKDIGLLTRPARYVCTVHEPTQRWLDSLR